MFDKFFNSFLSNSFEFVQALLQDHNTQKIALQQQLLEKDAKLSELESDLERLKAERPDASNLLATLESDKVAASRAMTQNQELRQQLEEMQHAYVQVVCFTFRTLSDFIQFYKR